MAAKSTAKTWESAPWPRSADWSRAHLQRFQPRGDTLRVRLRAAIGTRGVGRTVRKVIAIPGRLVNVVVGK